MTQVKSAQDPRGQFALRKRASGRSLAQRRADFARQMREMALLDLQSVAKRLRELETELKTRDKGTQKWTQQEIALGANVPYRTYQSWIGAQVENEDGEGYGALARFYTKRLGRKITADWIQFGERQPVKATEEPTVAAPRVVEERANHAELLAELAQVKIALKEQRSLLERVLRNQESGS